MIQEFYEKLSDRERKILYITLAIIVGSLFDLLVIQDYSRKMKNFNEEIIEKRNSIKRDSRFLLYKDKILQEKEELKIYYADQVATDDEIKSDYNRIIEELSSESNIKILKIRPDEPVSKSGYILFSTDLECEGAFEDMIKFMHTIDSTSDLLKIIKFSMSSIKGKVESVKVSMKIAKLVVSKDVESEVVVSDDIDLTVDQEDVVVETSDLSENASGVFVQGEAPDAVDDTSETENTEDGEPGESGTKGVVSGKIDDEGTQQDKNKDSSVDKKENSDDAAKTTEGGAVQPGGGSDIGEVSAKGGDNGGSGSETEKTEKSEIIKDIDSGERFKLPSFQSLWEGFIGGGDKSEEVKGESPATSKKKKRKKPDVPQEKEEPRKNLWERMLQ